MTLLIAWMVISGLELSPILYVISFVVWIFHLACYSEN